MIFEILRIAETVNPSEFVLKIIVMSEEERKDFNVNLDEIRADIFLYGTFTKIFEENKDMKYDEILNKFFIGKKIKIDRLQPYLHIAHNPRFID